jgi:DNA-binding NarL/FixJ family response regulator
MTAADTTTVVVDDHDVARLGLVAVLESIPGVRVVAEAHDAPSAIEAVRTHVPDLVLMDVRMPDTEGLAAARQICAVWPTTRVVMVSYWNVPEYIAEAFRAGATGYLSKGARRQEIADEIDRVLRGDPPCMCLLRHDSPEEAGWSAHDAHAAIDRLTRRQREVLAFSAIGLTNREIGERLGINWRTVQKTLENVFRHLGVPNRTQAAMVWSLSGWNSRRRPRASQDAP